MYLEVNTAVLITMKHSCINNINKLGAYLIFVRVKYIIFDCFPRWENVINIKQPAENVTK